jgi:uncharacterized protein
MIPLVVTSVIGGLGGAFLLIKTSARTFLHVLPWMMLGATQLSAFGTRLTGRISAGISHDAGNAAVTGALMFEFAVAVYGGYFGGGLGIMNLAMLAALGMTDIHAMNKLKVMLGGIISGVAAIMFVAMRVILWPQGLVLTAGSVLGGYSTAHFAVEGAAVLGKVLRDFGRSGDDDLFFSSGLSSEFLEETI